jgi:hypothetical protein
MQPVVIKRERVTLSEPCATRSGPPRSPGAAPAAAPALRAIEHDGSIVALELTCSCGGVSLVELRYPASQEARP